MLGRAVVAEMRRAGWPVLGLGRQRADVTDPRSLERWVGDFRPSLVVNCAAFTKVDACETERETAMAVNGDAVAHVVDAARSVGAALLHVSTDYVFDGTATEPIPEEAETGPRSVYGESKLRGEREALRYDRALVVRASWLFGPGGPNFAATMRRLLRAGTDPLRVVDDQRGRPTYTPFLARALRQLALRLADDPAESVARGVIHYGNRPAVTWHGFATEIASILGPTLGKEVEVLPVGSDEFPRPAERPAYSVFDVRRFEALAGRRVETWICGLAAYLEHLRSANSRPSS